MDESDKEAGSSITLPPQDVFRNLKNAKRFAIDIGSSLTKIAYYSTASYKQALYSLDEEGTANNNEDVRFKSLGTTEDNSRSHTTQCEVTEKDVEFARLHFIKCETEHIKSCLSFIKKNLVGSPDFMQGKSIKATGSGASKYTGLLTNTLGLTVEREDEMECLIKGCNFVLRNISDEVFEYSRHATPEYKFHSVEPNMYPYILVNIGSGMSVMKVDSESTYERIGGSAMGGGTFWGLGSLLTGAQGFDELLQLAEKGDHRKVDMLVKDIYGRDCDVLGLPADLIACSFGKAIHLSRDANINPGQFLPEDIARSLLFMISNDIGQLACLYAMNHNLTKVYFGGYFLRAHYLSMHTISFAINYFSKGKVQALFLRHEGYLTAIGAFLKGAEECDNDKYSWCENYAGSSGLSSPLPVQPTSGNPLIDQLEIDCFNSQLVHCPLLKDPAEYVPDTVDLTQDVDARDYWLNCFEEAIDKFVARAIDSQLHHSDAHQRAQIFKEKYLSRLKHLRTHPFAFGSLTVRSLLDMREHCLTEFDFPDPYLQQKRMENEVALKMLKSRLDELNQLDWEEKQIALVTGLVAGNVFDWGAKEVAKIMESSSFGFTDASKNLEARPWLVDDVDAWLKRLKGKAHKCAAIFVDNSGMDVVLGVLPFALELLKRNTKVFLCANSKPALNDVTFQELNVLMRKAAAIVVEISDALSSNQLRILDSGQASPCLDLSRLNLEVAKAMEENGTDLIVIEGMGRAIHTNLNAQFKCESIKAAVLKNHWLATRLGGDMFSVVFKYEWTHSFKLD